MNDTQTDLDTAVLKRLEYGVAAQLRANQADFAIPLEVGLEQTVSIAGKRLYLKIQQDIMAQRLDQAEWRYPADWKEAVKERFAPAWFKRRWPVRYQHVKIEVEALYPKIALPNEPYFLKVNRYGTPRK